MELDGREHLDARSALHILCLAMCPHCAREAPIVYRGVVAYCTACGGLRAPLSGPSLNLAGKPAKVGGVFANVAGVLVLGFGLPVAFGVWLLAFALSTAGIALAFALPIALVALGAAGVLFGGAYKLRRAGADAEKAAREHALLALAAQKGAVTAGEAARACGMSVAEADAILTELAKREPARLSVDVDDQGSVWFRATALRGPVRVATDGPPVRVSDVDAVGGADVEADAPAPARSESGKARR